MPIEVKNTGAAIIEFDSEMRRGFVLNEGESGECGDDLAKRLIEEGRAEKVGGKTKSAKSKKPKKEKASADPELGEARKRYRDVFGKNPGPKWTVEEIDAKIAEEQGDDGDDAGAPPA